MWKRFIIPCTYENKLVGYTARSTDENSKPKYHNSYDTGYVYGMDDQLPNAKFVIVTEGILDAMCIGGVGVLSNNASETQAEIIDTLAREVVLVPDRDSAGQKLIDDALEYGWSVSFPEWETDVKDINDAVVRYGKLFTLKSIIDAKQTMSLKINLMRKRLG
jgi:DNA primase